MHRRVRRLLNAVKVKRTPQTRSHGGKFSESNLKRLLESMPKEMKHVQDAQRQRLKIKEKLQKYVPGKVTLQVLGSGAEGAPKSLYMFTDQSRYLFNCGEGTQRLAHEHKMKLSKLEHIFVTEAAWSNIGGLPGVSLTIQDVGVPEITLHGPDGLDELYLATRRFVILKDLSVRMADCDPLVEFEDSVMKVRYVPIYIQGEQTRMNSSCNLVPSSGSEDELELEEDTIDYYQPEQRSRPHQISSKSRDQDMVMCYVCRLQARPGALSLEKCVELGVPPGPLLGRLKAGQDVTLQDGKLVASADVCLRDEPGAVFLVVDCPDRRYLHRLVHDAALGRHQGDGGACDDDLARLVVHFTPSAVMATDEYTAWMAKFGASTQHLVLNDANSCTGSAAVHRIQHKLHLLHPQVFPLLAAADGGAHVAKRARLEEGTTAMRVLQATTLTSFQLRPSRGLDRSAELRLDPPRYVDETMVLDGFKDALQQLGHSLAHAESVPNASPYPKVLFLGTGSCIPNKTRNTSGILVQQSQDSYMILDCGEGTYGQLVRFFGREGAAHVVSRLRAVYVSHLHADHHIGLLGLLMARRVMEPPLLLLAPRQILSWLHTYHRRFQKVCHLFDLVALGDLLLEDGRLDADERESLHDQLGMRDVSTVLVKHCPYAYGVSFRHREGWKLTYSGDTMPCDSLVRLGMDSDLLIHEATMEDELEHEAVLKMHSTTSQAVDAGRKMRAKNVVLTHFSQRYAKLPRFSGDHHRNVAIAFDNMLVSLPQVRLLPLLYPALRIMFADHCQELEHKAVKRQLRTKLAAATAAPTQ